MKAVLQTKSGRRAKTQKCRVLQIRESGWFRKGEHKHVFAYSIERLHVTSTGVDLRLYCASGE